MKPDHAPTRKETYRPTHLMNTGATALPKIPANPRSSAAKGSHTKTNGDHSDNARVLVWGWGYSTKGERGWRETKRSREGTQRWREEGKRGQRKRERQRSRGGGRVWGERDPPGTTRGRGSGGREEEERDRRQKQNKTNTELGRQGGSPAGGERVTYY